MALIYHFSLWLCGRTRLLYLFLFIYQLFKRTV